MSYYRQLDLDTRIALWIGKPSNSHQLKRRLKAIRKLISIHKQTQALIYVYSNPKYSWELI